MLDQGMAENIIIQYKDIYKQAIEDKLQSVSQQSSVSSSKKEQP
jgi:hypothetical protein